MLEQENNMPLFLSSCPWAPKGSAPGHLPSSLSRGHLLSGEAPLSTQAQLLTLMTQIHPYAPFWPSPKLSVLLSECLAVGSGSARLTRALNLSSKLSLLLLFPVTVANTTGPSAAWALSLSASSVWDFLCLGFLHQGSE